MFLMCTGITIAWHDVPAKLIQKFQLEERIIQRSATAEKEILFLQRHRRPLLPVFYEGELQILPWGNRQRNCNAPLAWWCEVATLASGAWAIYHPEPAEIQANFGLERGVWFQSEIGSLEPHARRLFQAGLPGVKSINALGGMATRNALSTARTSITS